MWTNVENKFLTPPPSWRKQKSLPSPMSERKRMSPPVNKTDDSFHVIHKVPAGDSPYVRAKHIQLIDKDPSRAISMFWAAINAGDRVDSALKDMAVVMKQLDRSDEAIEAIKSFRHLCPYDSQESLDNILIELYKRSGRVEEEIEMLQRKLKNIEEGIAFGGARTKLARSQGKKVQITIEQERSRILGNLAWAYMQQNNYDTAEQCYRKALSLEADKNKQCNLAICLMHMNQITEAKALLLAVKHSSGNKPMDISYAKSYERATQLLIDIETKSSIEPSKREEASTSLTHRINEESGPINDKEKISYSLNLVSCGPRAGTEFCTNAKLVDNWRRSSYLENQSERHDFKRSENWASPLPTARRNLEAPFTQPRRTSRGSNTEGWRRERWEDNKNFGPDHRVLSEKVVAFTQPRRPSSLGSNIEDWRRAKQEGKGEKAVVGSSVRKLIFGEDTDTANAEAPEVRNANRVVYGSKNGESKIRAVKPGSYFPSSTGEEASLIQSIADGDKKSWADMVEEEETEQELCKRKVGEGLGGWNTSEDEEFSNENLDSNIIYPNYNLSKKLTDSLNLKEKDLYNKASNSSRNPSARRSLCFDQNHKKPESEYRLNPSPLSTMEKVSTKRRNRLQVFQEISPGSP